LEKDLSKLLQDGSM